MAERFLYPPRPTEAVPFEAALDYYKGRKGWIGQYKFNDSRTLVWFRANKDEPIVELWDRHNARADYVLQPELEVQLWSLLEKLGGLSGEWSAVDAGLLHTRHSLGWMKNKFAIYDVLALNGKSLVGTKRSERVKLLEGTIDTKRYAIIPCKSGDGVVVGNFVKGCAGVFVPNDYEFKDWEECWREVGRVNKGWFTQHGDVSPVLEGLVMKYNLGCLEPMFKEKNNGSWMCRSRIETRRHRF